MKGKVHVAMGCITGVALYLKYPAGMDLMGVNVNTGLVLLSVAAGSYAPDVDNPRTHAGMKHKITSKVVSKVGNGHRGITHTFLFPAILWALMLYLNIYLSSYSSLASLLLSVLFGFELGWVVHILTDLLNGKGCPILWPLSKHKVHIVDLPSTGAVPWLVVMVYGCLVLLLLYGGSI